MHSKYFNIAWIMGAAVIFTACGTQEIRSENTDSNQLKLTEQNIEPAVSEFVETLAEHRETLGCPELIWDEAAAEVAYLHSKDMKDQSYFNHTNLEGDSPFDRMSQADIPYGYAAENIAAGYLEGAAVFTGWFNSPGHKTNMENCTYTHHGVGIYEGYWTHVFYKPL